VWHYAAAVIDFEEICAGEWVDWYRLNPQERWRESMALWRTFIELGGTPDVEPDSQSPFGISPERSEVAPDGGAGLRVVRRGGI
jgi:hypothetical protein